MPRIPDTFIQDLKDKADIVEIIGAFVPLKRRGSDFWGCCPFHQEKTPSFKVSPQRQNYYCFGCKKSGNVFHFVEDMINTDFIGAIHWLADRLNLDVPEEDGADTDQGEAARRRQLKETGLRLLKEAAAWYTQRLNDPAAQPARDYLARRGLDVETVNRFGLGYSLPEWRALIQWAMGNGYTEEHLEATGLVIRKEDTGRLYDRFRGRLMFPIRDELGRVAGFSARLLDAEAKEAKYVNSPESMFFQKGSILYGLDFARQAMKQTDKALVCEGQLDVIACHRAGLTHAVAAQGTAFTEHHARLLKRSTGNVVLAFDADTAGEKAARRTIGVLHAAGLSVDVVTLPAGEDPDSIFRTRGAAALTAVMAATQPALAYLLQADMGRYNVSRPEQKSLVVNDLLNAIMPLPDPVARAGHCQWLAEQLKLPESSIYDALKRLEAGQQHAWQTPTERGGDGIAVNPAPGPGGMPVFSPPPMNGGRLEAAMAELLDLILHNEACAKRLAAHSEIQKLLPDNNLGKAIVQVLAAVDLDEWADAEAMLSGDELIRDPAVGKVLADPHFRSVSPDNADEQERQEQAFEDCERCFLLEGVNRQIQEKQRELATAADAESVRRIQGELVELMRQKAKLK